MLNNSCESDSCQPLKTSKSKNTYAQQLSKSVFKESNNNGKLIENLSLELKEALNNPQELLPKETFDSVRINYSNFENRGISINCAFKNVKMSNTNNYKSVFLALINNQDFTISSKGIEILNLPLISFSIGSNTKNNCHHNFLTKT